MQIQKSQKKMGLGNQVGFFAIWATREALWDIPQGKNGSDCSVCWSMGTEGPLECVSCAESGCVLFGIPDERTIGRQLKNITVENEK